VALCFFHVTDFCMLPFGGFDRCLDHMSTFFVAR
jgi:hypothetical protein